MYPIKMTNVHHSPKSKRFVGWPVILKSTESFLSCSPSPFEHSQGPSWATIGGGSWSVVCFQSSCLHCPIHNLNRNQSTYLTKRLHEQSCIHIYLFTLAAARAALCREYPAIWEQCTRCPNFPLTADGPWDGCSWSKPIAYYRFWSRENMTGHEGCCLVDSLRVMGNPEIPNGALEGFVLLACEPNGPMSNCTFYRFYTQNNFNNFQSRSLARLKSCWNCTASWGHTVAAWRSCGRGALIYTNTRRLQTCALDVVSTNDAASLACFSNVRFGAKNMRIVAKTCAL